jgi:hypothetical protein
MRHYPHPDVNSSNQKCYIVDQGNKKTIYLSMKEHGPFKLVDIGRACIGS